MDSYLTIAQSALSNRGGMTMELSGMMDRMKMTASQRIRANEGDYTKDGLLYCHKCNTPKQIKVELFGQIKFPMCLCKCEADRIREEEKKRKTKDAEDRIMRMKRIGFSNDEIMNWNFNCDDHSNNKLTQIAMNYVDNFCEMYKRGKGLLFYGDVGTGKTFISACICNALIDDGYSCVMTNFATLTNEMIGLNGERLNYIKTINKQDLFVIDDLSSERDTEFMGEMVQMVIDARYRSGKPMIVTTNLISDELKHPADVRKQRIYSRLLEMCVPVHVTGKDKRKEKLKADYKEMEGLLGL